MPFLMIRNDIAKVAADAIVNPANRNLLQGSGTSRAIYQAAGEQELTASASRPTGLCGLRMTHRAWRSTTTLSARRFPGCGRHPAARPSAQSGKSRLKPISRSGIIGKGGNSHVRSNFG